MAIIFSIILQLSISLGLVPHDFDQMTQQEQSQYIDEVIVGSFE